MSLHLPTKNKLLFVCFSLLLVIVLVQVNPKNFPIIMIFRLAFILAFAAAIILYYLVKVNIDETYTSYKSGVEYGLSNIEKSIARKESRCTIRIILICFAIMLFIQWQTNHLWPFLLGPVISVTVISENSYFMDFVQKGYIRKNPTFLPRSQSGRLM